MSFELYSECELWYGIPMELDDDDWYEEDDRTKNAGVAKRPGVSIRHTSTHVYKDKTVEYRGYGPYFERAIRKGPESG
jgi:hypothetical protein